MLQILKTKNKSLKSRLNMQALAKWQNYYLGSVAAKNAAPGVVRSIKMTKGI
jgi:hypothetical protein